MFTTNNPFEMKTPTGPAKREVYPAVFPYRIIAEADRPVEEPLAVALTAFTLKSPLAREKASAHGKYVAFSLAVELKSREEMEKLDATIKAVPGVKLVL